MATTTASGWFFAGDISAIGAIVAAPRIPNLMGGLFGKGGAGGGLNACEHRIYVSASNDTGKVKERTDCIETFYEADDGGHGGCRTARYLLSEYQGTEVEIYVHGVGCKKQVAFQHAYNRSTMRFRTFHKFGWLYWERHVRMMQRWQSKQ